MLKTLFYITSALILVGCSENDALKPAKNTLKADINIEYAENFKLSKTADGYHLDIIDPNSKSVEESYELKTSNELKIISLTSTLNGMLSILKSTDLLVGISDINYVYDSKIKKRFDNGELSEHGDESSYSIEKILDKEADVILYSGFGNSFPNENKLKKMGLDLIPIYDWRENHPLGKAEWIKVVGVLIGKEKEANAYFNFVKEQYDEVRSLINEDVNRPSILSGNLIGDIWYAPAGNTYAAKLISDAGGDYRYAEEPGTVSLEFSMESIIKNNESTEFWINPGTDSKSKIDRINPHAKYLKAYTNVYCYSPNMNKYWERAASEPHLVLSDLIHILHPEIEEIKDYHFYEKIIE